jgi:phospholipid transport system substrate-binding protein
MVPIGSMMRENRGSAVMALGFPGILFPRRTSRVRAVVAVSTLVLAAAARAKAATPAENFVSASILEGTQILKDASLSAGDRNARIGAFLSSLLDVRRGALFALGPAEGGASAADVDAYLAAFRDFTLASCQARMEGFDGRTIRVSGSTQCAPGDVIVSAQILAHTSSGPAVPHEEIGVRIVGQAGQFQVVDAHVEGAWMMVAERDDCQGYLRRHAGDIGALTAHLRDRAEAFQAVK